jgi:ERCC4-type nuclease
MQPVVMVDTREQKNHVTDYLNAHNIPNVRSKLFVGDYTLLHDQSVCVDRKQSLAEVCGNVCQQHDRFRAELERAQAAGIKLIMLVEHGGKITSLDRVMDWVNPRLKTSPYAVSGEKLHKIMVTLAAKYGVEWRFCQKRNTGKIICQILGIETKEGEHH